MPVAARKLDVARLLEELRKRYGDTVKVEEVAKVVGHLMMSGTPTMSTMTRQIHAELEALAKYIQTAKAEVAALRPQDVKEEFLPTAAHELDAIVEATAEATNTIMDAVEVVEGAMDNADDEVRQALTDATTRIYEACSFQDITGQRITKVVKTLQEIEGRVDEIVAAFDDELDMAQTKSAKAADSKAETPLDEDLLQGPQKAGEGISQDEIDRLLAELD